MENNKDIEENLRGCFSVGLCMLAIVALCLMLAICGCRPVEKTVEVVRWSHDTTTVVDTVHVRDVVIQRDSIFSTQFVTQFVKDSTTQNVAWKHYTYDKDGNVTSLLDYTSSTQHGSTANTASQSEQTGVSDQSAVHEEKGSHSESSGHSDASQEKEQAKTGLTNWQRFIQILGYIMFVVLVLGATFGCMRLYGKLRNR